MTTNDCVICCESITNSNYNCNTLLKSDDFKESLKSCKGIIVLSDDLKNKFIANGINNVYSLIHPTTVDVLKFKFNNFITNPDKKIIYIDEITNRIINGVFSIPQICDIIQKMMFCEKTIISSHS